MIIVIVYGSHDHNWLFICSHHKYFYTRYLYIIAPTVGLLASHVQKIAQNRGGPFLKIGRFSSADLWYLYPSPIIKAQVCVRTNFSVTVKSQTIAFLRWSCPLPITQTTPRQKSRRSRLCLRRWTRAPGATSMPTWPWPSAVPSLILRRKCETSVKRPDQAPRKQAPMPSRASATGSDGCSHTMTCPTSPPSSSMPPMMWRSILK
jgi:hypothetical protein